MINLLIGAPGGGKSYEATAFHVLPALEGGRKVITNLPLNREHIESVFPQAKQLLVVLTESKTKGKLPFAVLEDWQDDWRHPETSVGPLIIVDECHQVLPRVGTDQRIVEFAALHRHTGADWLLMTQDHGKINKDIKALVQLSYVVRKNVALGNTKEYTRSVYDGLKTSGTSNRVNQTTRKYNPAYFKFYKSHTLSNAAVLEEGAKDVTPTFRKFIIAGLLVTLAGPVVIAYRYLTKAPPASVQALNTKRPTAATKPVAYTPSGAEPAASARRSTGAGSAPLEAAPPLAEYQLRLLGNIGNAKRSVWLFAVERNGMTQFTTSGTELYKAGYRITEVADCVVQIDHPSEARPFFVRCGTSFAATTSLRMATEAAMPAPAQEAATRAEGAIS